MINYSQNVFNRLTNRKRRSKHSLKRTFGTEQLERRQPFSAGPLNESFELPSTNVPNAEFGASISISGNTMVVGAPKDDSGQGLTFGISGLGAGDSAVQFNHLSNLRMDAHVAIPHDSRLDLDSITMEAVVRWDGPVQGFANPADEVQRILEKSYSSSGGTASFNLTVNGLGEIGVELLTATGSYFALSDTNLSVSANAHVAATYDGSTMSIYIDGTASTFTATGAAPSGNLVHSSQPLGIGNQTMRIRPFYGVIDEVALYDTALSQTQIADHQAALAGPEDFAGLVQDDSPVGYWRMTESSSYSDALDVSGNELHGTYRAGINVGSAHVYEKHGTSWVQIAKLGPSDSEPEDQFGRSVSISDDTILVGAPRHDNEDIAADRDDSGAAYVFERDDNGTPNNPLDDTWIPRHKIVDDSGQYGDVFGYSVAISGDNVVVGAPENDNIATAAGNAFVFARDEGGPDQWGQVAELSSVATFYDNFGIAVDIDDDTIVVGSLYDDPVGGPENGGSAYVFQANSANPNQWDLMKQLTAGPGGPYGDVFGSSVAVSGNDMIVGAPSDDAAGSDSGSAFIFHRNQDGTDQWGQVAQLVAGTGSAGDRAGTSVSISADKAVVGAPFHDGSGSAYVFKRDQGGTAAWGEVAELTSSDNASGDRFGNAVANLIDTVGIGSSLANTADAGSADMFNVSPISTGRVAYHSYDSYVAYDPGSVIHVVDLPTNTFYQKAENTIADRVQHALNPKFSPDGSQLVFAGLPRTQVYGEDWPEFLDVFVYDFRNNTVTNLSEHAGLPSGSIDEDANFSPDGSKVIFKRRWYGIYSIDLESGNVEQIAGWNPEKSGPRYSPDGAWVTYWTDSGAPANIVRRRLADGHVEEIVSNVTVQDMYPTYMDDDHLAYSRWESDTQNNDDIYVLNLQSSQSTGAAFNTTSNESDPFAVAGNVLGFSSDRVGADRYDVFIQNQLTGDLEFEILSTPLDDLGGTFTPHVVDPVGNALYVWRGGAHGTAIDLDASHRLADFAVAKGIDTIYYDNWGAGVDATVPGTEPQDNETLAEIVSLFHSHGLRVEALYTDTSRMYVDPNSPEFNPNYPFYHDRYAVNYNHSVEPEAQFDGIRLDIESFASGAGEPVLSSDLDVYDTAVTFAGTLSVNVSIGFHWDNMLMYNGTTKEAFKHISDIVSSIDVQTAQDGLGENPIVIEQITSDEIEYAYSVGKPVHVTVETFDVVANLGLRFWNTFFDNGEDAMDNKLADLKYDEMGVHDPTGFAYHFYGQSYGSSTIVGWETDIDDQDFDDIIDSVDGDALNISDGFDDSSLGGSTSGQITKRADRNWLILDEPDDDQTPTINEGVRIVVGPGNEPAQLLVENDGGSPPTIIDIPLAGADLIVSHGSTVVEVLTGMVSVSADLRGESAKAVVPQGGSIRFDVDGNVATISNTGAISLLTESGDQDLLIAPGELTAFTISPSASVLPASNPLSNQEDRLDLIFARTDSQGGFAYVNVAHLAESHKRVTNRDDSNAAIRRHDMNLPYASEIIFAELGERLRTPNHESDHLFGDIEDILV